MVETPQTLCAGCQLPITERYLLYVLDKPWHLNCVRCADCLRPLNESCFFRDNLILCRSDFEKRYGARCAACNLVLESRELVRKARDSFYHCQCFRCTVCNRTLDTGEQLYIVNGYKFICHKDFVSNQSMPLPNKNTVTSSSVCPPHGGSDGCLSDYEEDMDDNHACTTLSNESNGSGSEDVHKISTEDALLSIQKRRGPRTTIKAKQLEILKAAFASTPKPTRHIREQLAAETGLNMRVIQVWYQNKRSKERRLKQMRANGTYRTSRRRQRVSPSQDDQQQIDQATTPTAIPPYMGLDIRNHPPMDNRSYYPPSVTPIPITPTANPLFTTGDMYSPPNGVPLDDYNQHIPSSSVPPASYWQKTQMGQSMIGAFGSPGFDSDYHHSQHPAIG